MEGRRLECREARPDDDCLGEAGVDTAVYLDIFESRLIGPSGNLIGQSNPNNYTRMKNQE